MGIGTAINGGQKSKFDQEDIKRICLELMAPMVREFTRTVVEMRQQGANDADIAALLDKVEAGNRGKVEDELLDTMMRELRRVAQAAASEPEAPA